MATVDTNGPDACRNLWNTRFLDVPAVQYWSDFLLWERFLREYPIKYLVELGTGAGGLSLFLLLQCIQREIGFATFDSFRTDAVFSPVGKLLDLENHLYVGNLWTEAGEWVRKLLDKTERPVLLFCDNGDKPREVALFTPLLRKGDFFAVHDFHNEFDDPDLPAVLRPRIMRVFAQEAEQIGSMTAWWQVVA